MRKEIGVNNVSLFFSKSSPPNYSRLRKKRIKENNAPIFETRIYDEYWKKNGFSVRQQKKYRLIDVILYYSDYNSVFFVFFPITY